MRTVKSFATENIEHDKFMLEADKLYNKGLSRAKWDGLFFCAFNTFNFGTMTLIIYYGTELKR